MLCERCKIREANIQYTEIVNGMKTEHHFCSQCARELDFGPYSAIFDSEFPLGKLLSGLLGVGETTEEEKGIRVVCPNCGLSYEEFVKNSRFGCPDCYGVFDLLISDKIKQLQGSESHKGKRPAGAASVKEKNDVTENRQVPEPERSAADVQEEIRLLDARLKKAVRTEDYETAAQCRDKIKLLREEMEHDEMV